MVDVFEEDPLVEATALAALTARFRQNVLPAQVMSRGESPEDFQNVGQFRGQLLIHSRLRFMRLLQQLRPQSHLSALRRRRRRFTGARPVAMSGGRPGSCLPFPVTRWGE
jgi:hypothetical protein